MRLQTAPKGACEALRLEGLAPISGAPNPKTQNPPEKRKEKTSFFPKKGFQKKAPSEAKTLRFAGVGPKSAKPQAPQNHKKRNEKKQRFFPKRPFEKKRPTEPKPCVLKGLARKARSPKHAKNHKKRSEKNREISQKGLSKKSARRSQNPAFWRGWPEKRRAPRARRRAPKNTKKGNAKRPKSFSADSGLSLRQLRALRARRRLATIPSLAFIAKKDHHLSDRSHPLLHCPYDIFTKREEG